MTVTEEFVEEDKLIEIWNQKKIPVILRRDGKGEKIRMRMPYAKDNRAWLEGIGSRNPSWDKKYKCWELPKSWFNNLVDNGLDRWGKIYVVQPYNKQEKCSPACMNAKGHTCECSCMGANHGQGDDGSWFSVSETFATRWLGRELACRLMQKK